MPAAPARRSAFDHQEVHWPKALLRITNFDRKHIDAAHCARIHLLASAVASRDTDRR